mgnify:CR=1 FL=1
MKIEHIALRVKSLKIMIEFYEQYFGADVSSLYRNESRSFTSCFLRFKSGCRLELMHWPLAETTQGSERVQTYGLVHFAISVGSRDMVNSLTECLRADGWKIVGEPRTTGDGYYESVVLDPENNRVEITA